MSDEKTIICTNVSISVSGANKHPTGYHQATDASLPSSDHYVMTATTKFQTGTCA